MNLGWVAHKHFEKALGETEAIFKAIGGRRQWATRQTKLDRLGGSS